MNQQVPSHSVETLTSTIAEIKNGVVIDGSGLPGYRADVGVRYGRIVTIGRIRIPPAPPPRPRSGAVSPWSASPYGCAQPSFAIAAAPPPGSASRSRA